MPGSNIQMRSNKMAMTFLVGQLDVNYYIEVIGQKTQVYYDNTGEFEPDRSLTPTTLIPHVMVSDEDTGETLEATIDRVEWTELTKSGSTIIDDNPNPNYQKLENGKVLVITRNVVPDNPVDIRIATTYNDFRGNGRRYTVITMVHLTTIKDADMVHPRLNIISESTEKFDPFFDAAAPLYTFHADCLLANKNINDQVAWVWYAKDAYNANFIAIDSATQMNNTVGGTNTPVSVGKFPAYTQASQVVGGVTKGQGTDTIVLDARYAKHMQIKVKAKYLYAVVVDPTGNPQQQGWYEQQKNYTAVSSPTGNPKAQGWYELVDNEYVLTNDTVVESGKTYYSMSISYVLTTDTTVVETKVYYTDDTVFFKDECVRGLEWVTPNCDLLTVCENGSKVLQERTVLKFSPLINVKCMNPRVMEDSDIDKLYVLNWKKIVSNISSEIDMGWGKHIQVDSDSINKQNGVQTSFFYDAYLQQEMVPITDTNPDTGGTEPIVENGELVFGTVVEFPSVS